MLHDNVSASEYCQRKRMTVNFLKASLHCRNRNALWLLENKTNVYTLLRDARWLHNVCRFFFNYKFQFVLNYLNPC